MTGVVYFIGAGPGAPDLLTVRADRLIRAADVVIYADSLVHPDVARLARPDAQVEASSRLTLEQMSALTIDSALAGKTVARLQSGDPSVYGALLEQLTRLRQAGVRYEIVPGVSSAFAAAALLSAELTVPGVSQTIILTRTEGRTGPLPPGEDLRDLARHQASMALFLSGALLRRSVPELIEGGYAPETPAALVYRATWEDERIIRGRLVDMADLAHAAGLTKQALLMVGGALDPALLDDPERRSNLYDPAYSHGRRIGSGRTGYPHPSPLQEGEGASLVDIGVDTERSKIGPFSLWERAGVREPSAPKTNPRTAVIAVSRPGMLVATRIAAHLPHATLKLPTADGGGVRGLLRNLWTTSDAIVMVMAAGAATRLIAPLLTDKRTDPGVVVVDDAGTFAISLLGGHRAEANAVAQAVAAAIGAQAVTTTAAEALGVPSVETLARDQHWFIENDGVAVTHLAAALVNGERIGVVADQPVTDWWPGSTEQVLELASLEALIKADVSAALVITDRVLPRVYASNLDHWVMARPQSLVLGVGCSSGAAFSELEALVLSALAEAELTRLSVAALATIDRRADEPAILELAGYFGCPVHTYTADQLATQNVPTPSETVHAAVGTPSVCEAAALLASGTDVLVQTKRKNDVATVAIARRRASLPL
ncbi:MAG: precorrin-4 C(11)-methyltransferase [Chloroflexota bacterium]